MPERHFMMRDVFPADDTIGRYVTALAIALGDMRIAAKYAVREDQPDHERIYFVRLLTSHIREAVKLVVLEYRDRQDVRDFVASVPEPGRQAREDLEAMLDQETRPGVPLLEDLIRIRNDSFHYPRDEDSQERVREVLEAHADTETSWVASDNVDEARSHYADLVAVNLMHPFPQTDTEDEAIQLALDMHGPIADLSGPLGKFVMYAEATWITSRT
jgi:hypothetical protein